jgi:hypothetical protein
MNWSARGNVLNQYLRNTSIGMTVKIFYQDGSLLHFPQVPEVRQILFEFINIFL